MSEEVKQLKIIIMNQIVIKLLAAFNSIFSKVSNFILKFQKAPVTNSEKKLSRLVSEFGRICERRKCRVNVGKSKVMMSSRYGNGDKMHAILNSEPLEEVDC